MEGWFALLGPAGIAKDVDQINATTNTYLKRPEPKRKCLRLAQSSTATKRPNRSPRSCATKQHVGKKLLTDLEIEPQ